MDNIRNILEKIKKYTQNIDVEKLNQNLLRMSTDIKILVSDFIKKLIDNTKETIKKRSAINVIIELSILCVLYLIGRSICINNYSVTQVIAELFLLSCSYFGSYYFLPKYEFEFKTFFIYILSIIILFPALAIAHTIDEVVNLERFIIFLSLIVGMVFRLNFDSFNLVPAMIVSEINLNSEHIEFISKKHKIIIIADMALQTDRKPSPVINNFFSVHQLSSARKFLKFIKILSVFTFPVKLIYASDSKRNICDVCKLANEFGLGMLFFNANENAIKPMKLEAIKDISILEKKDTDAVTNIINGKLLLLEYNGNPILQEFIKYLSSIDGASLFVSCSNEKLYADIIDFSNSTNNFTAKVSDVLDLIPVIKPDIVFSSLPFLSELVSLENLQDSIISNVNKVVKLSDISKACGVKSLYIISNSNAVHSENWNGLSQRLAELYAQNYSYMLSKNLNIIAVRLPKTPFDPLSLKDLLDCSAKYNREIILNDISENIYDVVPSLDLFLKLIILTNRHKIVPGRIFSILPNSKIDINAFIAMFESVNGCNIIKGEKCEEKDNLPPLDEPLEASRTDGIFYTDYVCGKLYDISEIDDIKHCKSVLDLSKVVLSSVHDKVSTQ